MLHRNENGNTLTKTDTTGQTSYAWDVENRLASVTLPNGAGVVAFKYDPFGRRIQKSGPSGTTIYVYDGANAIEELNTAGAAIARYVQGAGIDEPLAQVATGLNYYQADGLGSITSMTDATGAPAATFVYGAFGVLSSSTGSVANSFRYTAREFDQDTGLYYYRARYYSSETGRFLSEDPAAFAAGLNFYSYVRNSPAMWVDPFGLEEGSASNLKKRNNIDLLAQSYDGSTTWNFYKRKPPFPANSNKCNLFVYDVTTEAGAEPRIPGRPKWPMPTASEWANPKVRSQTGEFC
jgi:RHS repeat-associated protein